MVNHSFYTVTFFIPSFFLYHLYYIFRSLNTLILLVVVIWSLNVRYDIQSILLGPKIENDKVLQNIIQTKKEFFLDIKANENISVVVKKTKDGLCLIYNKAEKASLQRQLTKNYTNIRTSHCETYIDSLYDIIYSKEEGPRANHKHFTSSEDVGTKLAFLYVVHHQVGIFEILLHLTFRPYNAYCIYVGSNSDPNVIASITQLVECYKTLHPETNIFMAKDTKSVKWGNYSLLEADLICMEQLLALRNQ